MHDLILIGEIVAAHGVRGTVKVRSFTESEDLFDRQEHLILIDPKGRRHEPEVIAVQTHKSTLRLSLKNVESREAAETLVGSKIYIPKTDLPPLEEGIYYWIDLIGLEVHTSEGELLGRISEIIPTGANDVYVVKPNGRDEGEVLIPAIASVVQDIDLKKGRVRVTLPQGLM